MEKQFSYEERCLFAMLKEALGSQKEKTDKFIWEQETPDWQTVFAIADRHVVLPLLYDVLESCSSLSDRDRKQLDTVSRQTVVQNYRLLFLTKYLVNLLEEHQITAVVMKGSATAAFYPTPELRKSGDVDLLIPDQSDLEKVDRILCAAGFFVTEEQHANHHVVYRNAEGIDVEIHNGFCEPFDNKMINQYMQERVRNCTAHYMRADVMGVTLPVLDMPYHAYQLLLHMLQHFLRAGFGMKLLCDWVVLWQRAWSEEEIRSYQELVKESGICGFSDMIFAVCREYFGLKQWEKTAVETEFASVFLKDILEAEEFGKSSQDRMVVVRGTKLWDYMREFHYQMKLTYPKSSRYVVCWPVLWMKTLVGFLYRNHSLRRVSTIRIMKNARSRSRLVEGLRLFEK